MMQPLSLPALTYQALGPVLSPLTVLCPKGRFVVPEGMRETRLAVCAWALEHLLLLPEDRVPGLILYAQEYAPAAILVSHTLRGVTVNSVGRANPGEDLRQWANLTPGCDVAAVRLGCGALVGRAEHYHARMARASGRLLAHLLGEEKR